MTRQMLRSFLARLVDAEVRSLRAQLDASVNEAALWYRQWGRSLKLRAIATEHLKHALNDRDEAQRQAGRYRLAWLSARKRADRYQDDATEWFGKLIVESERQIAAAYSVPLADLGESARCTCSGPEWTGVPGLHLLKCSESGTGGAECL